MATAELSKTSSVNDTHPVEMEGAVPDVAAVAEVEELLEGDAEEGVDRGSIEVVKEAGTVRVLEPAETGLLEAVDEPDDVERLLELRLGEVEPDTAAD